MNSVPGDSMPNCTLRAALAALVIPTILGAQAAPAAPRSGFTVRPVVQLDLEFGGAAIGAAFRADGGTFPMTTGQGGTVSLGGEFRANAWPRLALVATAGYKRATTDGDTEDLRLVRVPLEVLATWQLPRDWWVGAGAVHHTGIRYTGAGPAADFDDATGATLELGWRFVSFTFTSLDYKDPTGFSHDADAVGVAFRWVPGARRRG